MADFIPVKLRDTRMRNSKISRGMSGGLAKFRFAELGVALPPNDGDLEIGGERRRRTSKRTKHNLRDGAAGSSEFAENLLSLVVSSSFFFSRLCLQFFLRFIRPFHHESAHERTRDSSLDVCSVSRKIDDIIIDDAYRRSRFNSSNSAQTCVHARLTVRGFAQLRAPPIWSRAIVENYLEMAHRTTVRDLHVNRWTRWIASSYPPLPSSAFFYLFSPFGALHAKCYNVRIREGGKKDISLQRRENLLSQSRLLRASYHWSDLRRRGFRLVVGRCGRIMGPRKFADVIEM